MRGPIHFDVLQLTANTKKGGRALYTKRITSICGQRIISETILAGSDTVTTGFPVPLPWKAFAIKGQELA